MMNINLNAKKKYRLVQVASLFMILFLTGCGSIQIGRDFNVKAFESMVKVGKTSQTQVRNKLGAAKSSGIAISNDGERLVEWVYFFVNGKISDMDSASLKILQIRFDKNSKVKSYSWSNSNN